MSLHSFAQRWEKDQYNGDSASWWAAGDECLEWRIRLCPPVDICESRCDGRRLGSYVSVLPAGDGRVLNPVPTHFHGTSDQLPRPPMVVMSTGRVEVGIR